MSVPIYTKTGFFKEKSRLTSIDRMLWTALFLPLVLLLTVHSPAFSQSKKELERKKEQLKKDIDKTNRLLNQTRQNKSNSMTRLVTLNKKITYRAELINTISEEITTVESELGSVSSRIDSLNRRLNNLRERYAVMLVNAYKHQGSFSQLSFILSAEDMHQAYKRMTYLRKLSTYRVHQRDMIRATQDTLTGKRHKLEEVKSEKSNLLASKQVEKQRLSKEKQQQEKLLVSLSANEKKLRAELKKKQSEERLLSVKIEQIIRQEIASATASAKKRSGASTTASVDNRVPAKVARTTSPSVLTNTPESLKLSADFESNRGRLPWPVEQGVITGTFGTHPHPAWKDIVVNNNGVNISSGKGARARAVFDGKVIRVFKILDKYAVLIQHGEYFTVYSNLESVNVAAGEKVTTKQMIGILTDTDGDGRSEVHLEIWKGSNKMNPEPWLAAR
jgi:septal ring factor EnvC (AmiA/AmiB activator)